MIARFPLFAAAALALSSCAPGEDEERDRGPPIGFELASVSVDEGEVVKLALVAPTVRDLSVDQLKAQLALGNIRLIDVRTEEEVATGTIPGAEHVAMDRFDPSALDLSDGREVILYCRSGRRSAIVGERLAEYTGRAASHLAGGILAWERAGGPIELP